MHSIATMAKSNPEPTAAERLASAMRTKGVKNVDLATYADVTPGAVSQWVKGRRPVPANKARAVAEFVGVQPEQISLKYGEISEQRGVYDLDAQPSETHDPLSLDKTINRIESDIDALRMAFGVLAGVMVAHRPAEAADVAKALRKHLSARFARQGFVHELLELLKAGTER
jgi:transcriptional regulator with XRE-family HTH domain